MAETLAALPGTKVTRPTNSLLISATESARKRCCREPPTLWGGGRAVGPSRHAESRRLNTYSSIPPCRVALPPPPDLSDRGLDNHGV